MPRVKHPYHEVWSGSKVPDWMNDPGCKNLDKFLIEKETVWVKEDGTSLTAPWWMFADHGFPLLVQFTAYGGREFLTSFRNYAVLDLEKRKDPSQGKTPIDFYLIEKDNGIQDWYPSYLFSYIEDWWYQGDRDFELIAQAKNEALYESKLILINIDWSEWK